MKIDHHCHRKFFHDSYLGLISDFKTTSKDLIQEAVSKCKN